MAIYNITNDVVNKYMRFFYLDWLSDKIESGEISIPEGIDPDLVYKCTFSEPYIAAINPIKERNNAET